MFVFLYEAQRQSMKKLTFIISNILKMLAQKLLITKKLTSLKSLLKRLIFILFSHLYSEN